MERVESSSSNASDGDIWAKLVPPEPSCSDIELKRNEETISLDKRPYGEKKQFCKITRRKDHVSASLMNKSSCSIIVDGAAVQPDDSVIIRCGSGIILGPRPDGPLKYMFKVLPTSEICKQQLKISIDPEHTKCPICLNVWHDVVTVAPCLHNFCNGCFSEWLSRCQEKRSCVLCPQCRAEVQFVGRNHFLHTIEEDILLSDSSLRRSNDELALLDSMASIRSPLVVGSGRKDGRKRARTPLYEENVIDLQCPQCVSEHGGFRCSGSTIHLQCEACAGMMPFRADAPVPQHCFGCDRAFCGAYWSMMGVGGVPDVYPLCSHETLKPIAGHSVQRIPFVAHEKNIHEHDITEKCLRQMGRTLQDVISEWIRKFGDRELDRSRLQLNQPERLTPQTHVCRDCYDKLVSFLLYWFRVSLPSRFMPPEARQRKDCWYGYACRTQHHNEDHARKRNHVCRPTRGHVPTPTDDAEYLL